MILSPCARSEYTRHALRSCRRLAVLIQFSAFLAIAIASWQYVFRYTTIGGTSAPSRMTQRSHNARAELPRGRNAVSSILRSGPPDLPHVVDLLSAHRPGVEILRSLRLVPLPNRTAGRLLRLAPAPQLMDVFLGPYPAFNSTTVDATSWVHGWGCLHVIASTYGHAYENITADFDDPDVAVSRATIDRSGPAPPWVLHADIVIQTKSGEDHTTLLWCAPALRNARTAGVTLRLGHYGAHVVAHHVELPPSRIELAVCTVIGQNAPGATSDQHMLLPWIKYHRALGVGHFFLCKLGVSYC